MTNEIERLRVGLIGATGRWGPSAHIPAIQHLPETELYAVCTAHEETAQAASEKYSVELFYHDDKVMNENPQIEAVSVAVRVPAHFELTKNAIEAGKHVFCEWPLGANLKEAEALASLARERKIHTMVGLQRRASPVYLKLQELVGEGYVGEVLSVNLQQLGGGVLSRTSDRSWQKDAELGANTLTIGFGHAIDAVCMIVGEIIEVSGLVMTQVPQWYETDTEQLVDVTSPDNIMMAGTVESGAVVNANVGVHPYHGSGYKMEIYGRLGTLVLSSAGGGGLKILGGRKDDRELHEIEVPDRLTWVPERVRDAGPAYEVGQMWANFARSIRNGIPVEPGFDHAVRRHKLLDAIQQSSDTGQRQKLD